LALVLSGNAYCSVSSRFQIVTYRSFLTVPNNSYTYNFVNPHIVPFSCLLLLRLPCSYLDQLFRLLPITPEVTMLLRHSYRTLTSLFAVFLHLAAIFTSVPIEISVPYELFFLLSNDQTRLLYIFSKSCSMWYC